MYIYTCTCICTYHVTEFNLYIITAFVDMVPHHRIDKQLFCSCEGFKSAFKIAIMCLSCDTKELANNFLIIL